MSSFWHAALKNIGAGAVSAFVLSQTYTAILDPNVMNGLEPWQRFSLLALIAVAVFFFCFFLLGYGLKLLDKRAPDKGVVITVKGSKVSGYVVGGDKVSYKERK